MLASYFKNARLKMTKESYYELCEMLNSQPLESEIPVEYGDLPIDVQEALDIYYKLKDEWDTMNGMYLGKNYSGLSDIFDILGVEDKKTMFNLIGTIDKHRSEAIEESKSKEK